MPKGKGTYGSKRGRPPKKRKKMGINSRKIINNWNINKTVDGIKLAILTFND